MGERMQPREIGSGQYTYDKKWDRLCRCGHTLGVHSAVRTREGGVPIQDCMAGSGVPDDPHPLGQHCECKCFTLDRRKKASPPQRKETR